LAHAILARSISEEFSSGDARYREEDPACGHISAGNSSGGSGGSGSGGSSSSASQKNVKEKDDRDEGKQKLIQQKHKSRNIKLNNNTK
jgi:hypothetical protein